METARRLEPLGRFSLFKGIPQSMTDLANSPGRPLLRIAAAIGWMGLIFLVSNRTTLPQPPGLTPMITAALGHFSVYFVLAILVWWVLGGFGLDGRPRWLMALALAVLYGVSDEWHQSFVPGRTPDVFDVLVDALGAACGLIAIGWADARWSDWTARRRRPSPRSMIRSEADR